MVDQVLIYSIDRIQGISIYSRVLSIFGEGVIGLGYFPSDTAKTVSGGGLAKSENRDYIQALKEEGKIYSQIFGINIERFENLAIHPSSVVIGGWDGTLTPDNSKIMWIDIAEDNSWTLRFYRINFGGASEPILMTGTSG
jgi:hypothetical protein